MSLENTTLIGHEKATAQLQQQLEAGTVPASLIIAGDFGIGKCTLALHLARALLKDEATAPALGGMNLLGEPEAPHNPFTIDFESPEQQRITHGSHPDLKLIQPEEGKQDISVDAIRAIGQFLSLSASEGGKRVVIIDAADNMNRNAANALLKNLEEPPANTHIILISHKPYSILPTLRSRCVTLSLAPLSEEHSLHVLEQQDSVPNAVEAGILQLVAPGAPGAMAKMLEQGVPAMLQQYFLLVGHEALQQDAMRFIADVTAKGKEQAADRLLAAIVLWLGVCLQQKMAGLIAQEITPQEAEARTRLCASHTPESLEALWHYAQKIRQDIAVFNQDKTQALLGLL